MPTPPPSIFDLALDAAGNHRPIEDHRWYGVSGDGTVILGATPGDRNEDDGLRGIAIGLR